MEDQASCVADIGQVGEQVDRLDDLDAGVVAAAQGPARSTNLLLEYDRPLDTNYGLCKPPVAAGLGAGDLDFDIVPGSPEESILIFRMDSTEAAIKMPELSRSLVHEEGVALVSDWIATLPGSCD